MIGAPGALLMLADGFGRFKQAVRRKIIREIATAPGPPVEHAIG